MDDWHGGFPNPLQVKVVQKHMRDYQGSPNVPRPSAEGIKDRLSMSIHQ